MTIDSSAQSSGFFSSVWRRATAELEPSLLADRFRCVRVLFLAESSSFPPSSPMLFIRTERDNSASLVADWIIISKTLQETSQAWVNNACVIGNLSRDKSSSEKRWVCDGKTIIFMIMIVICQWYSYSRTTTLRCIVAYWNSTAQLIANRRFACTRWIIGQ